MTAAMLFAAPARADLLPPLEGLALPSERAVLNELILDWTRSGAPSWDDLLRSNDEALRKLREPTRLRGYVQFSRATALFALDRDAEALQAVEESIRLLPEYSGPLILGAWILGYAGEPGRGADYLLRASYKDPDSLRNLEDYEVNGLIQRLRDANDEKRIRVLSDRLLEIGWLGRRLGSRSSLALDAIKRRMAEGELERARALVPQLIVPAHSRSLLIDNRYRALWPDIEKWAGPKLERQWMIYLTEARERWAASKDLQTVEDYTGALLAAGHQRTVIRDILPLFAKGIDPRDDYELMFVATGVARSLAHDGRWNEIELLYRRAQAAWPLGEHANALNIAANHARWLLFRGSYAEALKKMEEAIEDARNWGSQVNLGALVTMHMYRTCMLRELGRDDETAVSIATVTSGGRPEDAAWMYLCLDNPAGARNALIAGLTDDRTRTDVLAFVQPSKTPPIDCDFGRRIDAGLAALKADPVLLREVVKYGRVLPYDIAEGAPAEDR